MRILITGAGGYVGSILSKFLLEKNYKVVAVDNYLTGHKDPLLKLQKKYGSDQIKIKNLDLLSGHFPKNLFVGVEAVVHLASSSIVNESMQDPGKYFKNNLVGSVNLLDAMIDHNIKKLVFASSSAVYGEAQSSLIDEDHPTLPVNPYGESKLITEKIINWYQKLHGINYVSLRFFNICGAWDDGSLGDSRNPSSAMIQNAVRGALNIEPFKLTFTAVNTKDKSPIRDYIDVIDVAQAIEKSLLLLSQKIEVGLALNIGSGVGYSVLEVIETIKKIKKKEFSIGQSEPRKGEPAEVIANISQAAKHLGWKPKRKLRESIESLVNWYQKYPRGWSGD